MVFWAKSQFFLTYQHLFLPPLQIVNDLRSLRTLAEQLLKLDAVTYLMYLENLRATEGAYSVWLYHPSAHVIFEQAKRRVYSVRSAAAPKRRRADPGGPEAAADGATESGLEPVLEEMPKWEVLREALQVGATCFL